MPNTRQDIVRVARSYIGTPYHHQGRLPGVGMDCAGMPICIARELGMVSSTFDVPVYRRIPDGHSMLEFLDKYMGGRVLIENMQPGDIIVMAVEIDPQHIGIVGNYRHGGLSIIHANTEAYPPRVVETILSMRIVKPVGAYKFPGIE